MEDFLDNILRVLKDGKDLGHWSGGREGINQRRQVVKYKMGLGAASTHMLVWAQVFGNVDCNSCHTQGLLLWELPSPWTPCLFFFNCKDEQLLVKLDLGKWHKSNPINHHYGILAGQPLPRRGECLAKFSIPATLGIWILAMWKQREAKTTWEGYLIEHDPSSSPFRSWVSLLCIHKRPGIPGVPMWHG